MPKAEHVSRSWAPTDDDGHTRLAGRSKAVLSVTASAVLSYGAARCFTVQAGAVNAVRAVTGHGPSADQGATLMRAPAKRWAAGARLFGPPRACIAGSRRPGC